MIDHLDRIREAGVDALKIEGRMKSLYYTAIVTRAYRKHLDALRGVPVPELELYRQDVFRVSHREYCTGFYFGKSEVEEPAGSQYREHHVFLGTLGEPQANGTYTLDLRNRIEVGQPIEYIGPSVPFLKDDSFTLWDSEGNSVPAASHGQNVYIQPGVPVESDYILRKPCGVPHEGGSHA